jgi:hypothetical protein
VQATKTNLDAIHNRYMKRIKPGLDRWLADVSYNPDVRELIPGRLYSVASRTEAGLRHKVNWDGAQPSCSHEHFKAGTICSHIKAVAAFRARQDAPAELVDDGPGEFDDPPLSDPELDSSRALLDGAQPQPFHAGECVVYTSPRDGRRVQGIIQYVNGDHACIRYSATGPRNYRQELFPIAGITPAESRAA